MLIATFGPTTAWQGRTIAYEAGRFVLQDHGDIPAEALLDYDRQGQIAWAYPGLREWVQGLVLPAAGTSSSRLDGALVRGRGKPFPAWGVAALVLGAVVMGGAFLASILVPMFLVQHSMATDSAVREGVHSIQVGLQSYAVDNGDAFPDPGLVSAAGMGRYVDTWPDNPYTGAPMQLGTSPGDFTYTLSADGMSFELVGYGKYGTPVITAP
jgi:hypothetical protein